MAPEVGGFIPAIVLSPRFCTVVPIYFLALRCLCSWIRLIAADYPAVIC